jgi:cardiolipin synthase A/B
MAGKSKDNPSGYTENNTVTIVRGGADYFARIDEIAAGATYSLHFQTYIFDEDETGLHVAEALMNAARRGVLVYLMLDGYASQHLSSGFIKGIEAAGVHFRYFEPLFRSKDYYFGRRMHHKVLVADGAVCLIGGLNVSNRYNDMPGMPAWLDWALMVQGDVAREANAVCVKMWDKAMFQPNCLAVQCPEVKHRHKCLVRIRRNDWVYRITDITASYAELFKQAKSEITIMTSYFWPTTKMLGRMVKAARRGVKVRIVLTGNADVPLAKYAERYLYQRMFREQVEVYEYKESVLHGKAAIRDSDWVTVGSYNLNNISAGASVELNLDVQDESVAQALKLQINELIDHHCVHVTSASFVASSNVIKKFFYYLSYLTVHVLYFLVTFYFNQRVPVGRKGGKMVKGR